MRHLQRLTLSIAVFTAALTMLCTHAKAAEYTAADCTSSKMPTVMSAYSGEMKKAKTESDWLILEIGFRPALAAFQSDCKSTGIAQDGWFAVWMGWGTAMLAQMDAKGGEKGEATQFAGISRNWFAHAQRTSGGDTEIAQSAKKGLTFLSNRNL